MSLYRKILHQSWILVWRNKYLWFFGLFAVLIGNGGEYEIFSKAMESEPSANLFPFWSSLAETGIFKTATLSNIENLLTTAPLSFISVALVLALALVIIGLLIWLTVVSQIALVNNSYCLSAGKRNDIQTGVMAGIKSFWPVFGLNIIAKILVTLIVALIGLPLYLVLSQHWFITAGPLIYILVFLILIPLAVAVSFIIKFAIAYVVLKGSSFLDALSEGWNLFAENRLISIEMAFALFFINFFAVLAVLLGLLILATPFLFLAVFVLKFISLAFFQLIVIIALIVFLAMIILSGSILSSFQITAWTGLFLELVGRGGTSKLLRVFGRSK